ncbi:MAG: VCBS repeat-containing protein [Gammaproteobacteria bacterium]|nr:VCBS repeat-containing protein [Gammaproteobacteria bacterium]MYF28492.1 VCBS repeat-containing protein [Gammaproteobacteria bacterium]MYK46696.1 VCBS repeat-containing protein [Gammaproteobacteria bacterium]
MNMRCLITVSALTIVAAGCTATTAVDDVGDPFEHHEVVTSPAKHQTLLFGSFDGQAPLAVVRVDGTGQRHVHLVAFDGSQWVRKTHVALKPGVLFVDVARIDGHDRLVTYRSTGVHWLDLEAGTEHPLVNATTDFHAPEGAGIPHLDVMRDLNGDGRDDLCLPDTDGFWIALQSSDGSFAEAVKIGVPEPFLDAKAYGDERTYGEVGITPQNTPWYLRRVHRLDFDRDGRQDLAFWNDDHFLVYRQDDAGGFSRPPGKFGTDVPFHFDGPYSLAFQYGDTGVASMLLGFAERKDLTILNGFEDLNADGVADLVTLTLAGRSPLRLGGRYDVHFGRPTPGGTTFAAEPDTSATAPGRSAGGTAWGYASQMYLDFNNDGATDMGLAAVNTSLGGMVRAIAANSISMELALYGLRDGQYPARPDWTRTVRTRFAPLDKRGPMFPTVLVGDVNGDGRSDLLTGERWDELNVFLGTPGDDPVATRPIKVAVDLPGNELNARLADLDKDGKEDLVIQHPSATRPGRISILMAQ